MKHGYVSNYKKNCPYIHQAHIYVHGSMQAVNEGGLLFFLLRKKVNFLILSQNNKYYRFAQNRLEKNIFLFPLK